MDTRSQADALRKRIIVAQGELDALKEKLDHIKKACPHAWPEEAEDCSYTKPGYIIPGDEPGTMGVDWRGPVLVDSKTVRRWRRVCQLCGKAEETERSRRIENPVIKPVF